VQGSVHLANWPFLQGTTGYSAKFGVGKSMMSWLDAHYGGDALPAPDPAMIGTTTHAKAAPGGAGSDGGSAASGGATPAAPAAGAAAPAAGAAAAGPGAAGAAAPVAGTGAASAPGAAAAGSGH
jgi:hypothetical protein